MKERKRLLSIIGTVVFSIFSIAWLIPIVIIVMNSFKKKSFIQSIPFDWVTPETFAKFANYTAALRKYHLLDAVGWTVLITVGSVIVILICTSMCAWYITRVKSKVSKFIYLLCVFSMVVPFQMVMFTLSFTADRLHLNTPWGIIVVYLGFGAGLAVFMFCGFVKSLSLIHI